MDALSPLRIIAPNIALSMLSSGCDGDRAHSHSNLIATVAHVGGHIWKKIRSVCGVISDRH